MSIRMQQHLDRWTAIDPQAWVEGMHGTGRSAAKTNRRTA